MRGKGRGPSVTLSMKREPDGREQQEPAVAKRPKTSTVLPSPIHLTSIESLPPSENVDAVSLNDILRHADLTSMWQFNFMIHIPFVMDHIHPDARMSVKSYFVHGVHPNRSTTTKDLRNDANECQAPHNISIDGERLMNEYATHHSKFMVLLFGSGSQQTAQIVVHTANMIPFDWGNMAQGVWLSPRLPKRAASTSTGAGNQFKCDFLTYLRKYYNALAKQLVKTLSDFDFSAVAATFIASAPGNYKTTDANYSQFGVVRLQKELAALASLREPGKLIAQVSSIATLGATDSYLTPIMENAMAGNSFNAPVSNSRLKLIFPTVANVADSLNGYLSGSSIHFKRQTPPQLKQLAYLAPKLHQWHAVDAGRGRCAPHIKTYMKVSPDDKQLHWVLLTSANLSKQAWGTYNRKEKNQWIQSWECGVLIHPELFDSPTTLVPAYKSDTATDRGTDGSQLSIRMPFDLPLSQYSKKDIIWSPADTYSEPDWRANTWPFSF